jgi:hypothetical protein
MGYLYDLAHPNVIFHNLNIFDKFAVFSCLLGIVLGEHLLRKHEAMNNQRKHEAMNNQQVKGSGALGIPGLVAISTSVMATGVMASSAIAATLAAKNPNIIAQRYSTCRTIAAPGRTAFFTSLPQPGSTSGILQQGDRVDLLDGGTTFRGGDGQIYLRVAYPYDNPNRTVGYIPYRYTPAGGGSNNTLGYCEKRGVPGWW